MVILDEQPVNVQAVDVEYASFGERVLARIIDGVIIAVPSIFMPFIAPWLYFAIQEGGENGATIGKRIMGIRVVSTDGKRINFGTGTGRFFANFINLFTGGIGYLLMLFNAKNQCLHDMMTSTVVVRTASTPIAVETVARKSNPTRNAKKESAKAKPADEGRVWNLQIGNETHYLRLTEEGGQYLHRTPQGDFTDRFTLWQLADGKANFSEAFGETVYLEMQQHAENLMMRLSA
jgi:uncharacterized RDD family membrane protein YckC